MNPYALCIGQCHDTQVKTLQTHHFISFQSPLTSTKQNKKHPNFLTKKTQVFRSEPKKTEKNNKRNGQGTEDKDWEGRTLKSARFPHGVPRGFPPWVEGCGVSQRGREEPNHLPVPDALMEWMIYVYILFRWTMATFNLPQFLENCVFFCGGGKYSRNVTWSMWLWDNGRCDLKLESPAAGNFAFGRNS